MPLEEGERVVWEGPQSGVMGASTLWSLGAVAAGFGLFGLLTLPMLLLTDLGIAELAVAISQQLVCATPGVVMAS
ncbi:MAG: hypothetical protein IPQ07_41150, partial [Myxococcales bacterium]|nr:hypothetical protein [Myxococcales bacterium]